MSTYTPIQAITLNSNASEVVFTAIPQIYTDLVLVMNARYTSTNVGQGISLRFNGDSGTNYSTTVLEATSTSTSSYRLTNVTRGICGAVANGSQSSFGQILMSINDYSNVTSNKAYIMRQSGPTYIQAMVGSYRSTNPITSITIIPDGTAGNIASGSTFTLYGISAGTVKAFGGEVTVTGGFAYHVFRQSGVFTPSENISADILVVAGGGGGSISSGSGGGAGAGGLLTFTSQSLSASTDYSVLVGAGGSGTVSANGAYSARSLGSNGGDSRFGSLTIAQGGGLGGGMKFADYVSGSSGGSGGGGAANAGAGGTGVAGQGNNGGLAQTGGNYATGGGGGAGAAGAAGTSGVAGAGGIGATSALINAMGAATNTGQLSGGNYYFAGGGGGTTGNGSAGFGAGGLGGGGNGANALVPPIGSAGTTNTGGGAGGGTNSQANVWTAPNGGSGIVIVRYAI